MAGRRIGALDGVRGLAVLIVIFHNQRSQFAIPYFERINASGWMGVDLFFVLSGFLITGILLDTKDSHHHFRNFYARRCLRIWPLYVAVLVFMWVLVPAVRPAVGADIAARSSPWWAYPVFLQNFFVPTVTSATGPLSVSWSLAIEEQFYLFWPLVVWFLRPRDVAKIALGIVVLSPLIRLGCQFAGVPVYYNTFCRLDGLMAGAALALLVRSERFAPERFIFGAWLTLAVAAPLALVSDSLFPQQWFVFSLSVVASAALVYVAMFSRGWLATVVTNRLLVFTGTISYGLYLLHKIPFDMAKGHGDNHPWIALAILLALSYAAATTSWIVLEMPFLRLKRFFGPGSAPVPRQVPAPSASS